MIDWKSIKPAKWAKTGDTALAAELGTSKQNVAAARKRLGAPPSPESRGGDRKAGVAETESTMTIRAKRPERLAWEKAANASGMTIKRWIVATLNDAAG